MNNNDDILEIKAVTQVDALFQTKAKEMPGVLKGMVANFSPMQKKYAEYRSKGLRQADAAKKAGSTAKDRQALGRVGYNWEQLEGMKEYIAFLYEKRAQAAVLDEIEIVDGIRKALDRAMELDRIDWANKSLELLGSMIGAYNKGTATKEPAKGKPQGSGKTSTEAFKNEGEEVSSSQRLKAIQDLMHSMSKSKVYKEGNSE